MNENIFRIDFVTFESMCGGVMGKRLTIFSILRFPPFDYNDTWLYTRFKTANNDAVNVMIGRNPERRNLACI